jgi:tetratricopeptide (TPR) repeat protein
MLCTNSAWDGTDRMNENGTDVLAVKAFAAVASLWAAAGCIALAGCSSLATQPSAQSSAAVPPSEADREQRLRALQQAEALYLSGRLKEAQAAFEQLTRMYPRNSEIWFRYGNTLMKQGSYDDAAAALQNAVSLDPGQGKADLNLGLVRLAQAQAALASARTHLPQDSAERQQADGLLRRIQALLGGSGGEAPSR